MSKMLTVVARVRAKPGKEEQVREALMALVEPTRKEAGCINYDLHRSQEDAALFLFHENWISREALDKHLQMPYLQELGAKAEDLFDGPVEVTLWDNVS